jgi:hypothetical protein
MPRGGQNRLPVRVKQSYFELIRTGNATSSDCGPAPAGKARSSG